MKKNKLKIFFLLIVLSLAPIDITKAEEASSPKLFVSPPIFEMKVKRGETIENKIKIKNQSEISLPIKAVTSDFSAADETGQIIFDESEQDPSFSSKFWIKIERPDFILDPGEMEEVNFSISVPENAEPGGHYAVVLFEPQLPSFYFKEGQPRVIPKIGVLFLFSVEVEGLQRSNEPLTIVEFNIPKQVRLDKLENFVASVGGIFSEVKAAEKEMFSIVEKSDLPFNLTIKNNDIYHLKPEGTLTILKNNGQEVGETKISQITVLPGKARIIPVEFKMELPPKLQKYLPAFISNFISQNLLFGKYKADLSLTTGDNIIKKYIEFWVFPWKTILIALFVISLFAFCVVRYMNRLKLAVRVLVKKS